jgi:hypothetical protein
VSICASEQCSSDCSMSDASCTACVTAKCGSEVVACLGQKCGG